MKKITRPTDIEYAVYYEPFLKKLPVETNVLKCLKENATVIKTLLSSLTEAQLHTPFMPGKWHIKDILIHLTDFERIMTYRAMSFARNDKRPIPFFDENEYVKQAMAGNMQLKKLINEYLALRKSTIAFFENQTASTLKRSGTASNYTMSVRACAWIICGHEIHHLNMINEKYLNYKNKSE